MKYTVGRLAWSSVVLGVLAIVAPVCGQEDPVEARSRKEVGQRVVSVPGADWFPAAAGVADSPSSESLPFVDSDAALYIPAPRALPDDVVVTEHSAYAEGGESGVVGQSSGSFLVYSNTRSKQVTGPAGSAATTKVADDIATTAIHACPLDKYVVRVTGDRDNTGSAPAFTVTTGLYPTCPGAGGATLIPGTQCTFSDLSGRDLKELTCQVAEGATVPLPDNFYVAASFSRDNCGVVVGAPPELGFSADRFDFPGFACRADLGGYPEDRHASFWLHVYAREDCARSFVGYKNSNHAGSAYSAGASVYFADDIRMGVPECNMVAYEVSVKGFGIFRFDLRTFLSNADPETGGLIPGTQKVYLSTENKPQLVRFAIDPPISLPPNFYVAFKTSSAVSGPIFTGQSAPLGMTRDEFCVHREGEWQCGPYSATKYAAFDVTILCAGGPPSGACCDMVNLDEQGEAVCRDIPQMNCPANRWLAGATCEVDPFSPGCGLAMCCKPDDTCANLTKNECLALVPPGDPIIWERGRFCEDLGATCPFYACVRPDGDCTSSHQGVGCEVKQCCAPVCDFDPWCCMVEWDDYCARWTQDLCTIAPRNDSCFDSDPQRGAKLVEVGSSVLVPTAHASEDEIDRGFPCHKERPCATGYGTVWFKFVATDTSARVSTCDSPPSGGDTLVQVFKAEDPSSQEAACRSLQVIGCNDDSPGCATGVHSDVCVADLVAGETYYVLLASRLEEDYGPYNDVHEQGAYRLTIESPCPVVEAGPTNDVCENAVPVTGDSIPFDLTGATMQCPAEPCLGTTLKSDIWYDWTAPCGGWVQFTITDLGASPEEQPTTAVAVYNGCHCPPDPSRLITCDAGSPTPDLALSTSVGFMAVAGNCYKILLGGRDGGETAGSLTIPCRCGPRCPSGEVEWLDPPNGVVDARQPHPIGSPSALRGIRAITVAAPDCADESCWVFCETNRNPGSHPPYPPGLRNNGIVGVQTAGDGIYTIILRRPITPGEMTTISYTSGDGAMSTGRFISHPANVDCDPSASHVDIGALVDILRGTLPPLWGMYSADIDNSEAVGPADILALIDVLNHGWTGTELPTNTGTCP